MFFIVFVIVFLLCLTAWLWAWKVKDLKIPSVVAWFALRCDLIGGSNDVWFCRRTG